MYPTVPHVWGTVEYNMGHRVNYAMLKDKLQNYCTFKDKIRYYKLYVLNHIALTVIIWKNLPIYKI